VNVILWLVHLGVLWYSLPLLRCWWYGTCSKGCQRKRWAVALSIGMPPVAALWLVPCALRERRYAAEAERAREHARRIVQHREDVRFWREQAEADDPIARQNAAELLEMWRPLVRSEQVGRSAVGGPVALPGAHAYSHGCDCRNCVRSRRGHTSGRVRPPGPA
jgi:hypothetical protein